MYVDTEMASEAYVFFKPKMNTNERRNRRFRRARRKFFNSKDPIFKMKIFCDIMKYNWFTYGTVHRYFEGGRVEVYRGISSLASYYDINSAFPK